jgi:SAM-dependent methyltransferase
MADDSVRFQTCFERREQLDRYRDRFRPGGRHAETHLREQAVLRSVLARVGKIGSAMDLPAGTGRLSPVLAEFAGKVILADASGAMLEVARQDNPGLADRGSRPATMSQFFAEAGAAGLRLVAQETLCPRRPAILCPFEK